MATDDAGELRDRVTAAYGAYHDSLASSAAGRFVRFMNFGYCDIGAPGEATSRSPIVLPARMPNRNAARLVIELVGDEPIDGRAVADIGCGRGGALWLLTRFFDPRMTLGIDLAGGAVRAAGTIAPALALQGDAEALPLRDRSVEVVLNVESSLHYPALERFYAEVARVLRPGGALLYTDLFLTDARDAYRGALERVGLVAEVDDDITENVLASRAERAEREALAFGGAAQPEPTDVQRFVGIEGTAFHRALTDRTWTYRLLRLRRRHTPGAASGTRDDRLATAAREAGRAFGGFQRNMVRP